MVVKSCTPMCLNSTVSSMAVPSLCPAAGAASAAIVGLQAWWAATGPCGAVPRPACCGPWCGQPGEPLPGAGLQLLPALSWTPGAWNHVPSACAPPHPGRRGPCAACRSSLLPNGPPALVPGARLSPWSLGGPWPLGMGRVPPATPFGLLLGLCTQAPPRSPLCPSCQQGTGGRFGFGVGPVQQPFPIHSLVQSFTHWPRHIFPHMAAPRALLGPGIPRRASQHPPPRRPPGAQCADSALSPGVPAPARGRQALPVVPWPGWASSPGLCLPWDWRTLPPPEALPASPPPGSHVRGIKRQILVL